ncbi:MAG: methyl-accepting chemotaxis protein [Cyanobacteria bacterium P01_A01_bin.114]
MNSPKDTSLNASSSSLPPSLPILNGSQPQDNPLLTPAGLPSTFNASRRRSEVSRASSQSGLSITPARGVRSLKGKTTLLAATLGMLPVVIGGGFASWYTHHQLTEQTISHQQQLASTISLQVDRFAPKASSQLVSQQASLPQPIEPVANTPKFSVINHAVAYFEINDEGREVAIDTTRIQPDGETVTIDGQPFQPDGSITRKENRILASDNNEDIGLEIQTLFPQYTQLRDKGTTTTTTATSTQDGQAYLLSYVPMPEVENLDNDWGVLVYEPTATAFARRQTALTLLLGATGLLTLLAAVLGAYLAHQVTSPILKASKAVTRLSEGSINTRLSVRGTDELAVLGSNVNGMADQIQDLIERLEEKSAQQQGAVQAQAAMVEQQQQQREAMQQELLRLIQAVEGAADGDLTVRAELSTGEIGIVADVFNSVIENLRKIVLQVKQATTQVNSSVGSNQEAIQKLANNSLSQVDEISHTLVSVKQMSESIQSVAQSARRAATVAHSASNTAQKGGQAMDQTVDSILGLRATVAETTKKVKQLGESSQQISQVVALINEIALKTNLLAVNASIEAAHAGEEGQGFAVVAGEVGELADQSAAATKEIEQIVKHIQEGTKEVVEAMELSTTQVVEGTYQLHETKESLEEILSVSEEIDQLVQSISEVTVDQATTSQTVTDLMKQITAASQQTSAFSRQVDGALRETVEVAQTLESAIGKFKIGSES